MEKHFFSFGQNHVHRVHEGGRSVTLDCDSIVQINAIDGGVARTKMFDMVGPQWGMHYTEKTIDLSYFPRGVVLEITVEDHTKENNNDD